MKESIWATAPESIYAPLFKRLYQALIVLNIAIIAWIVPAVMLEVSEGFLIVGSLLLACIFIWYTFVYVYKKMWPHEKDTQTFWGVLKIAILNVFIIGYRQEGLEALPWKTILTWGVAAALIDINMIANISNGEYAIAILGVVLVPVVMAGGYGIGNGIAWLTYKEKGEA